MKYAILGSGVSGLTAGRLLHDKGHDVVIYEKNETIGGLARSRIVNNRLYDPHGGHIFNSKYSEVVDWVFSILPQSEWQYTERNAKIYYSGKYISYPFELSLCELDTEDAVNCIYDFILSKQGDEPDNYRDWLYWNFGAAIADAYMVPYNEKIWAYPLEKMETHWMRGKMPLPSKKEMIRSMFLKDPKERKMPHSSFYYPRKGGIQTMVDAIALGTDCRVNACVESIEQINGLWYINQEGGYDRIISTIPLPVLNRIMEVPVSVYEAINQLKYNSLTTILFDCPKTDITWLYIPSHKYRSHRVGYQSALTPYACPEQDKFGCAALEIIGPRFEVNDKLLSASILPQELCFNKILDYEFTEYAYVIHDLQYQQSVSLIRDYFSTVDGFYLLGRWGTWNYKNMDLCMLDAMNLVEKLEEHP